jgi:hypothetical protein
MRLAFDDMINATTWSDGSHPVATLQTVMNSVGTALNQAAPRHLVTNHLGGKQTCSDYQVSAMRPGWASSSSRAATAAACQYPPIPQVPSARLP